MAPDSTGNEESQRRVLQAELDNLRARLLAAEATLAQRMAEIYAFERTVDARLGDLSEVLELLEKEIAGYLNTIERQRNLRVYGKDHPFDSPDYWRNWEAPAPEVSAPAEPRAVDDETQIKTLYRRLARYYHPDLAEDERDLVYRTEKMRAVNLAYTRKSLAELKYLALEAKISTGPPPSPQPAKKPKTELDRLQGELTRTQRRLRQVNEELSGLHQHPSIQLSLDAKLAIREGRDLLGEMAADLRQKIARKTAERDFLKSYLDELDTKP